MTCDDVILIGGDLLSVKIALGNDAGFTIQKSFLNFSKLQVITTIIIFLLPFMYLGIISQQTIPV